MKFKLAVLTLFVLATCRAAQADLVINESGTSAAPGKVIYESTNPQVKEVLGAAKQSGISDERIIAETNKVLPAVEAGLGGNVDWNKPVSHEECTKVVDIVVAETHKGSKSDLKNKLCQ